MKQPEADSPDQAKDTITREVPGTLRAVAIGCAIGAVFVFAAVGGALYLSQRDVALALGLGGMSAIWGGLGFGAMLGGTIHLIRHSDEPHLSTSAIAAERALRSLGASEVPTAGRADAAARRTQEDARAAQDSSQVA